MTRQKNLGQIDLLHGPILRSILLFALPIFISMLFQQLYNAADTAIVGNVLGEESLAAIGSVSSVFDLIIHFATGLCSGFGIVIARAYGSGKKEFLKKAVAGSLITGLISVAVLTLAGLFGLRPLLSLIHTPAEIFEESYSYIRIISLFLFVTFLYNLLSGMLRSIGNSVMPLVFLIISSVMNVILDYLFIARFHAGVRGAAIATVISQAFSAVLCAIYLFSRVKLLIPEAGHFKVEPRIIGELAGQGFAMAMMSCLVSISSVILQSGINGLGTQIIAAHVAARKIFSLSALPFVSIPGAVSVFISQNRGAGQGNRILKAMKDSYLFFAGAAALMTVLLLNLAPALVALISGSHNPVILENGSRYLYILGPFLFLLGIINVTRSSLQGIGYKLVAVISSLIELAGKILFVLLLIPRYGYPAVIFCEPVIWVFMAAELVWAFYTNDYIKGAIRQSIEGRND